MVLGLRIAIVVPKMANGERGGAENLFAGLVSALRHAGHDAAMVEVVVDESSLETILESYCKCFYLDLNDYDVVISTKAPTYMVNHRNHVSYLLHTIRVFYDMFDTELNAHDPETRRQRNVIHQLDQYGLHPSRVKKHGVIGHTVSNRLKKSAGFWNDIDFRVIYPATLLSSFSEPKEGEFIFLPGRLHRWKRVDLVIKAMSYLTGNTRLLIAGNGEDRESLMGLAKKLGVDNRVEFLGTVSDEQLVDLYSRSIVVPFVAKNEDFGYVTIEAFKSKKPVITCRDSGEPACIVKDGINGFIVDPDPKKIAEKIRFFIENPAEAMRMGEQGYSHVAGITWDNVITQLIGDIDIERQADHLHMKVLVTDMQPIEPAIGGGRLRLKGLYSNFPDYCDVTYVGSFDWKGEKSREIRISDNLTELDIPLSDQHFGINDHMNQLLPGKTIIDSSFPFLAASSPDYLDAVVRKAQASDVVIFSHPWLYPALSLQLDLRQKFVVYDSQNVESVLREKILGQSPFARCLSMQVAFVEKKLCEASDLVLACSEEDRNQFIRLYGIGADKIKVVPNGVDARSIQPASDDFKVSCKDRLKAGPRTAVFIGSNYDPNVEGARYIIDTLADACKDVTFFIVGGVGSRLDPNGKANVRVFGIVSDEDKKVIMAASDIAINPMFSGSGTNIKMFDYLAAGLPTISTPVGARGIINDGAFVVAGASEFPAAINRVLTDLDLYNSLKQNGLNLIDQHYDWNKISLSLGRSIGDHYMEKAPFFSVVVPTLRSDGYIPRLFEKLRHQTFRDFEVILVDSGRNSEDTIYQNCDLNLKYLYRENIGAAKARNVGIAYARGKVVAFTDDDCLPDPDWLANARKYFEDTENAGIEGVIYTDEDKLDNPAFRTVTNKGFTGLGFMTANLFILRSVLREIGGFDVRFDKPHFREDTDLAWRSQAYGKIPFAPDVRVYHPPHMRSTKGESKAERDYFFINDALLFVKHPDKYLRLMKVEGHYKNNENYWKWFWAGCEKLEQQNVHVPYEYLTADRELKIYAKR